MNDQQMSEHVSRLRHLLVSLGNLFHTMNSEFCHAFGSLNDELDHCCFEHLNQFRKQISEYRELRWKSEVSDELVASITSCDSLAETDLNCLKCMQTLNAWLGDMASHDGDPNRDSGFSTWQSVTKAFTSFVRIETKFLDVASLALTQVRTKRT